MDGGRTLLSAIAVISGSFLLAACSDWSYAPPTHGNFTTVWINHPRVAAGAPPAGGNFIQETAHDYAGFAIISRITAAPFPATTPMSIISRAKASPPSKARWCRRRTMRTGQFLWRSARRWPRPASASWTISTMAAAIAFPASPPGPRSLTIAGSSAPRMIGRANSTASAIRISSPQSRRWRRL